MRPRERYLLAGSDGAGPSDLIALILGTGAGGRTSRAIATDLLDRFGGLRGLANASPAALASVRGVGPARAARLHAGMVLGQRARADAPPTVAPIHDAAAAAVWFAPALEGLDHEELHALYLDRRLRPLAYRRLTAGSDAFTVVDPRQVLRPAIELAAASLIIGHNHPSGDPEPSTDDIRATRALATASKTLGITLRDHLVVGGGRWISIANRGEIGA
ncbi:MAG: DNA repair protein RadC [Pseudomonadota bacterium]|nr:DNA repair protein RadC [Pseudomonadota bacterium]